MESTESPFTIAVVLYASISDLGVTRSSEHLRFPFFFRSSMFANSMAINYYLIAFCFFNRGIVGIQHHIHFCLLRLFLDIHANRGAISPITPAAPPAGTRPRRGGIPCAGLCARDSSVRTTLHFLAQPPPLWPSGAVLCICESVSVCVCRFRTDADPRGMGLPVRFTRPRGLEVRPRPHTR